MVANRRSFLTNASLLAAGNLLGFRPFGMLNALAQTTQDYKALVCIFLFGGNDANNMLIPTDTAGYANYLKYRVAVASGGLALAQNTLLPIASKTPQNGETSFGLHPNLLEVQSLYTSGKLAFLTNIGPLNQPV